MIVLKQKKVKLANEDDQEKNLMLVLVILSQVIFPLLYFVCLGQIFVVINKMSEARFFVFVKNIVFAGDI